MKPWGLRTTLVLKRLCDLTTLDSTFFSVVSFLSSIEIDLLDATHVCNDLTHALCHLMGSPCLRSCDRIVCGLGEMLSCRKVFSKFNSFFSMSEEIMMIFTKVAQTHHQMHNTWLFQMRNTHKEACKIREVEYKIIFCLIKADFVGLFLNF